MWRVSPEEITDGSIPRALLLLAAPLVLQNLVHVANAIVDTFWLGRLGQAEVAAVGVNFPIISIVAAGIALVALGTQISLAQHVGAGNHTIARQVGVTGIWLAALVGVVVSGAFAVGAEGLMGALATDPEVVRLAVTYLVTLMVFYPFAFVSDTVENAFVGWGDTVAALYINVVMVGTNIVLDPFLIFGFVDNPLFAWVGLTGLEASLHELTGFGGLGVAGAAMASGLGFVAALGLGGVLVLGRRDSFVIVRDRLRPSWIHAREIIDVGAPLCGQRAVRDVVRVVIIALVSITAGAAGLAAFTIGARVSTLAFVPAIGLQQAAQAMISQNLGADRPTRAYRTTTVGVGLAATALAVLGVIQWFVPGAITDLLAPDLLPEGRELSVVYLRILAISYWALGASYLLLAGFNGAKRTRTSFVVDMLKYWGIRFPIALVAIPTAATFSLYGLRVSPGLGLGVEAIFWAVTISNIGAALGLAAYFAYTTRRGMFERAAGPAGEPDAQ